MRRLRQLRVSGAFPPRAVVPLAAAEIPVLARRPLARRGYALACLNGSSALNAEFGGWTKRKSTWARGPIQQTDGKTLPVLRGGRAVGRHLPAGLGPSDECSRFSNVLFWLGGGTSLFVNESL